MQIDLENDGLPLPPHENWKVVALLENLPPESIPVCMVLVEPRIWRTGYNEEIDNWVANFCKDVFKENPLIEGRRFSWGIILFVARQNSVAEMRDLFLKLLADSIHPELLSKALFSSIQNSFEEKMREVEQMELQLIKIKKWKEHIYPSYYEDGIEKLLISS